MQNIFFWHDHPMILQNVIISIISSDWVSGKYHSYSGLKYDTVQTLNSSQSIG